MAIQRQPQITIEPYPPADAEYGDLWYDTSDVAEPVDVTVQARGRVIRSIIERVAEDRRLAGIDSVLAAYAVPRPFATSSRRRTERYIWRATGAVAMPARAGGGRQ